MASIFNRILNGEIKGKIIHQDELCGAISDIQPQAPHHVLIFPRTELRSLAHAAQTDQALLGHLLLVAAQIARDQGLAENGYRLVINTGRDGGQSVDHLHIHLLAGRPLTWPPG